MNPFIIQRLIQKIRNSDDQFLTESELNSEEKALLENYKQQIKNGYPLDYILGEIKFDKFILDIQEGVFIPREETEWWVNLIIKAKSEVEETFSKEILEKIQVTDNTVDLCCGSGYIGLSLSAYFKKILAVDLSSKAVDLSQKNAQKSSIKNYKVYQSNLFGNSLFQKKLKRLGGWILVCNPPYVPETDFPLARQNKVDQEPFEAIYSGSDGLSCFREIINQLGNLENKPTLAFFELDPRNIHEANLLAQKISKSSTILEDQNKLRRLLILEI